MRHSIFETVATKGKAQREYHRIGIFHIDKGNLAILVNNARFSTILRSPMEAVFWDNNFSSPIDPSRKLVNCDMVSFLASTGVMELMQEKKVS